MQEFALHVEDNIFDLHQRLTTDEYRHSQYKAFYLYDPKLRHIHKASVVDRVLHHAVIRVIEPLFDKGFIFDSYSSRNGKGLHKAVTRLHRFAWTLSRNNTKTVWALKCDVRKFFDSVDHATLTTLVCKRIYDKRLRKLLTNIITSFHGERGDAAGIPLGNLTSQLFSNIYLNPLDQYVKRILKAKNYLRYADDFIILAKERSYLEYVLPKIESFLKGYLKLDLHPEKIQFRKWHQGIDFLGYVSFPYHMVMRTKTKKRMYRKIGIGLDRYASGAIDGEHLNQQIQSYVGILKHCRGVGSAKKISDMVADKLQKDGDDGKGNANSGTLRLRDP